MLNRRRIGSLSLLLILAIVLIACELDPGQTQATTAAPDTTGISEPVGGATLDIIRNGDPLFRVIRDEDSNKANTDVVQARNLISTVASLSGATMTLESDWIKPGTEYDPATCEILIGNTAYPETAQVMQSLGYHEWAVRLIGNKLVVFGYNRNALTKATSALIDLMREGVSEDGRSISIPLENGTLELTGKVIGRLSALPIYPNGVFSAHYSAGHNCDEIIVSDTNAEEYKAYLGILSDAGFTQYTEHEIAGSLFATYTNAQYTVNVGYYTHDASVRILIEPLSPAVGLKAENVYTPVTTTQITMLGQGYEDAKGDYMGNGLSVLIRLCDGRFVVIDGGNNLPSIATALMKAMTEQSAAYTKTPADITVAAWIVTHPHGDHDGALLSQTTVFSGIKVERFLVNYISEVERQRSRTLYEAFGDSGAGREDSMMALASRFGAKYYQVHVGQVFYFADLELEVLFTAESYAPDAVNDMNATSTIMRMQFGGDDGPVYLSTGDATGDTLAFCHEMYGDYLQADLLQVAHHGLGTAGNDNGTRRAYETINAEIVLWPTSGPKFPEVRDRSYNAVLFKVSNFKECLVAGEVGEEVILSLPYTVGTAVEHRNK